MNYADRFELFLLRVLEAHCSGLRKTIRRFLAERAAGRETNRERFRGMIARGVCKVARRLAPINQYVPRRILKCALDAFPGEEDALEDFIGDMSGLELVVEILGAAYKNRDSKKRLPPASDKDIARLGSAFNLVLMLWDGFDICQNQKDAAVFHSFPPLSRWNHKAAWKFIKNSYGMPGLTYETYRKGMSRLGLRQSKPILVQMMEIDSSGFAITYTPLGTQWLRENHLLGAVTQNGKKMSHDMETSARFNAANGSGKITSERASTRRVRSGQRTPANNSPDLHPIACAESALSLERIQPERAR